MSPNVVVEYIWIRLFTPIEEYRFRQKRECPILLRIFITYLPMGIELWIYYMTCHPEIYSDVAQKAAKSLGTLLILLSRQVIFQTGFFSSLIYLTVFDSMLGICMISRYIILNLLGMPLTFTGEFQPVPFLIMVVLNITMHFTLMKWMLRFREDLDHPGTLLKCIGLGYNLPCIFFMRPPELLNLSIHYTASVSGIIMLVFFAGGWVYLTGYWKRMRTENHFLALQQSLYQEHRSLLEEQTDFVNMCRHYLEQGNLRLESMEMMSQETEQFQREKEENGIFRLVMQNKADICLENGIRLDLQISGLRIPSFVTELQMLTVFYNLLDNAMEAALACEKEKRYIQVQGYNDTDGLHIKMENSRAISGIQQKTRIKKKHQGLGLKIVRDIVRHHHGTMAVEKGKEDFRVKIFLPNDME